MVQRGRNQARIFAVVTVAVICVTALACGLGIYLTMDSKKGEVENMPSDETREPSGNSGGEIQEPEPSAPEGSAQEGADDDLPEGELSDWNLILLNPDEENKIDADLPIELEWFLEQSVDSRAAPFFEEMLTASRSINIRLFLRSGYRSMATQQVNYDASIQRYLDQGKTRDEAVEATEAYYTQPGHSEHHTGLAFDIITQEYQQEIYELDDRFAQTDAYRWLVENCATYGFILRYPQGKEDITGISFEPWHYRYVGVAHAKYIMSRGLCLEEYIELLRESGR